MIKTISDLLYAEDPVEIIGAAPLPVVRQIINNNSSNDQTRAQSNRESENINERISLVFAQIAPGYDEMV